MIQLRVYLEEPTILKDICNYAKQINKLHLLIFWAEILEFKAISPLAIDLLSSHMQHIYHKYIKNDTGKIAMPVGYANIISQKVKELTVKLVTVSENENENENENNTHDISTGNGEISATTGINSSINNNGNNNSHNSINNNIKSEIESKISIHMFDELQQQCIQQINDEVFLPYRTTAMFTSRKRNLDTDVNLIKADDFEYYDMLGQGAFGCVVHCVKKSTGKHYAMKIQTKMGMLDNFFDCPERVVLEKDGIASCMHPFIIGMDYAFQSRELTFMAMDLGEEGTLRDAMNNSSRGVLPLIRVQFYSAEIFLALAHMHRLGLIYRDLKPHNVILNRDGHIRLVDMGGIVDVGGKICGYHGAEENMGGLFKADYEANAVPSKEISAVRHPPIARVVSKPDLKRIPDSTTQRKNFSSGSTFKMSTVKPKRANSIMGTNGYVVCSVLLV